MNLRISFLLRLDESLSHFLRMEMEGFFELRKPLPLAFRVNYQGWLFILASHTPFGSRISPLVKANHGLGYLSSALMSRASVLGYTVFFQN